ncbi:CHASE2 domain-containing protein [Sphingosinicella rhizophila]|uniref:CHASE2 domain-containing protein n=1 Tax=Sphingosinicella rhizophila TaxID=3050082 RepID=A0ABU3QAN0_9SPHN|nr:CHASE2 domain-containing protein [Sphingosinicella sp. GR2756]MDT9600459.1 CHASE2 domain-containing protein [Sphingosinicella sp. GR2756]
MRDRFVRSLKKVGPGRLALTMLFLVLGLLAARYSWGAPFQVDQPLPFGLPHVQYAGGTGFVGDAERALYDIRAGSSTPRVDQDPRITLVVYDDQTLELLGKRTPLDRKMLAGALRAIDAMNPKAIGIDILIDQEQPEDPLLIDALKAMKAPVYLAFTTSTANPDYMNYEQEQFLRAFLPKVASGPVRPASIQLVSDQEDGVMRHWPDRSAELPPLLANAMMPAHTEFRNYSGAIAYRQPRDPDPKASVFPKLSIQNFLEDWAAEGLKPMVEGRYVLIGGDISDVDDFETPMTRRTGRLTKGLEVHAHLLAQQIDGRKPAPVPNGLLWGMALLVVLAGAVTGMFEMRRWKLAFVLLGQAAMLISLPFLLQSWDFDTLGVPAFGWGLGWALAFIAVGTAAKGLGSEQRRFAQSTLGKYLPADVAAEILEDPDKLTLSGEKREIFAMFTDLEDFTKLSHAITPEQLSLLLNRYLDILSETVLRHGGTIDKFVGDAIIAFWGAPIARDGDGDRALKAAMAMYQVGEEFRHRAEPGLPAIGCTRVGLHWGEAVVGNFGGKGRIQYTALGDGMNTAARLESANKSLKTTILVSKEAMERSSLDCCRPMGRIVLSGRAKPVEVWEPVPSTPAEDRERLTRLWLRFDGGDLSALEELRELAANGEDAALANLVYRLEKAGPGGHFVLDSK